MRFEHRLAKVVCRRRVGLDGLSPNIRCNGDRWSPSLWLAARNHVKGLIEAHTAQDDVDVFIARDDHAVRRTRAEQTLVDTRHQPEIGAVERPRASQVEDHAQDRTVVDQVIHEALNTWRQHEIHLAEIAQDVHAMFFRVRDVTLRHGLPPSARTRARRHQTAVCWRRVRAEPRFLGSQRLDRAVWQSYRADCGKYA